jgi:peptidyl-prolyl cis-trans isomerase D
MESKRHTVVAEVGDTLITIGEFDRAYQDLVNYYMRTFGDNLSPQLLEQLNLKQQVLERLISSALFSGQAERLGVSVTDDELKGALLENKAFQRNGRFDRMAYLQALRRSGLEPGAFEEMLRQELEIQHVAGLLGDIGGAVSEKETKDFFFFENEQINLEFITVSPQDFEKEVTVSDELLADYFSAHQDEFRTPPMVVVEYVRFSPRDFIQQVSIARDDVEEYYQDNIDRFRKPKRVKVRQIVLKVEADASKEQIEEIKTRAETVLAAAKETDDFAALATKYSQDPSSASRGGDLGYVRRGQMPPALDKEIFSMDKGDMSDVVRTSTGFHILKIEDIEEASVRSLDEVRDEVSDAVETQKATDLAAIHAEDAAYKAKKAGTLRQYASDEGLTLERVGPFAASDEIEKLGKRAQFSSMAFSLRTAEISPAFQDGDDYFVLSVVDKVPPKVPALDDIKQRVTDVMVAMRSRKMAQEFAKELLTAWKDGDGLEDLLRTHGLKRTETGFFKRNASSVPKIGQVRQSSGMIAALSKENPWPSDVVPVTDVHYVLKLKDVRPAEQSEFERERESYRERLSGAQQAVIGQLWIAKMQEETDIELNQELLERYR